MPFEPLDTSRLSGDEELEDTRSLSRASPDSDYIRKRRQRSNSSSEAPSTWSTFQDHRYQSGHQALHQNSDISPSSSNVMLASQRPLRPPLTASDGTSGSSRGPPSGEDSLTVRRREANRLAAQRFRSRKKGYQDSLEEKVRQLEEDKELLVRRLTEASGVPLPSRRRSVARTNDDRGEFRAASQLGSSVNRNHVASPERRELPVDADVRIAALESANRRLQDELRNVNEENDTLRQELEYWRRWERDQRESAWSIESGRRDDRRPSPRQPAHPLEMGVGVTHIHPHTAPRNAHPPYPAHSPYSPGMPALPTAHPQPLLSPAEHPHLSTSPGIRLPPIRLAPLQVVTPSDRAPTGISPSQYLPRPAELDSLKLGILSPQVSRSPGASGDDRRRGA